MEAAGGGGAAGGIALHDFSGQLGEQRVHFHAMRLRDSLFLWVGAAPALASLAVAMCSPRDSIPVAASLLGDPSDTASSCLARRLGRCGSRCGRAGLREPPPAGNARVGTGPCLPGGPEPPAWAGRVQRDAVRAAPAAEPALLQLAAASMQCTDSLLFSHSAGVCGT
uniref:Proteasome assembly chaperone 4 n=1 Tax=Taeniopygia guttata TaxID=59729 RepID=A0A674H114_TAEGU